MKTKLLLSAFCLVVVQFSHGQWTYTNLSEPKSAMGCTSLGNKAWFAGGSNVYGEISTVEVYNVITKQWNVNLALSVARTNPGAVACGSKVFVGGGAIWMSSVSSQVDIYDTSSHIWSDGQLAEARLGTSAVSYGNTVLFAGGTTDFYLNSSSIVDVYDMESGTWSTDNLSIQRGSMACAVVGDLAIFAGGFVNQNYISDQVDIYNFSTETWSIATLSEPRAFATATTVGNKVLIAGGIKDIDVPSDVVDIYDASTDNWSIGPPLSTPRALANAATVNGKAYFVGGATFNFEWHDHSNVIDIYDGATGIWSVDTMIMPRIASVVGVGDYLVIAGGDISPTEITDLVEIFHDTTIYPGISSQLKEDALFRVYPNPSTGNFHIEMFNENHQKPILATIYNLQGQMVYTQILEPGDLEINLDLPAGVYVLRIIADNATYSELITVQ